MSYQLDKQVADRLKAFFEPFDFIDKVVIFGSRAKHNANPKSDIDLCIYSLEMSDAQFSKLKLSLDELPILYAIDIVHFEKSNEALRENIERDGKLLFVKKANLGDVALFIRNGLTVQQDKNKKLGCPITRIETISHGVINFDAVGYADLDKEKYESWLLKKGDILISHINSEKHLGKSAIYTDDKAIIHGMNLLNFRVKENISSKYLFYYLKTPTYKESIHKIMKKSVNQASFSLSGFKNIEIPLPSLTKQKEIAQTLDKASELIKLRKATIQKLDELAQSIFIDMFGDPISNNKQTSVKGFLEIFNVTTGKLDSNASEENGIYPFFTCAQETLKINQFAFDLECLLLAGNNAAGKYSVKYYNGKFNAYQRTYILTLKNPLSSYKFFKYALEMKLSELQNISIGSNTKYLTLKILERVKMFDPTRGKQEEFTFQIEKLESQKSLYEAELTQFQATFDALLSQSFEG